MAIKKKILLVDDEEEVLTFLGNTLRRQDYEVIATSKGKEAVRLAKQLVPDLIILDILMPDMFGEDVAAELREDPTTKHIPVVFLTAIATKKEEYMRIEAGRHYGVIAKPVNAEELLARIKKIFGS